MNTLLTGALLESLTGSTELEPVPWETDLDAAICLVEILLDGYQQGELGFESLCERSRDALWAVEGVQLRTRHRLLGNAVQLALDAKSRPRRRAGVRWERYCEAAYGLTQKVSRVEGLPIVRSRKDGGQTAFARTAEILQGRGAKWVTAASVEKAYYDWKSTGTRKRVDEP